MSLLPDERTAVRVGAAALLFATASVVFLAAIAPRLQRASAVPLPRLLHRAGRHEGGRPGALGRRGHRLGREHRPGARRRRRRGRSAFRTDRRGGAPGHRGRSPRPHLARRRLRHQLARLPVARYVEILPPPPGSPEEASRPVVGGLPAARRRSADARSRAAADVDQPHHRAHLLRAGATGGAAAAARAVGARRVGAPPAPRAPSLGLGLGLGPSWGSGSGSGSGSGLVSSAPEDLIDDLTAKIEAALAEAERAGATSSAAARPRSHRRRPRPRHRHLAPPPPTPLPSSPSSSPSSAPSCSASRRSSPPLSPAPASRLVRRARALSTKLASVEASVDVIATRWKRREGTLGRLLSDPEFPEDAKELGKILKRQPWRIFAHPDDTAPAKPERP